MTETRFAYDPGIDWDQNLIRFLISKGTAGVRHKDIITRFQHAANATEITARLNAWHAEDKVQQFLIKTGGRSGMHWRATTEILKD